MTLYLHQITTMKSIIKITITLYLILTTYYLSTAQVAINETGNNPDASAMLDIQSTDKGILIPRMTTAQRTNISNAATGLLVFDNDTGGFWFYNGSTWQELSNGKATMIADADADTKIEVEAAADEDSIRMTIAGTERLVIRENGYGGTLLSTPNNGQSVFLGEGAGNLSKIGTGPAKSKNNAFIGYKAGALNTSGKGNVFLGTLSGASNTSGDDNIFLGNNAGLANTTGNENIFIGSNTGQNNIDGEDNIFIGNETGNYNVDGKYNVFIGLQSGYNNTEGNKNVFLGVEAGYGNTTGDNNVFVGNEAGEVNETGGYNVFLGDAAGVSNTIGNENTFLGGWSGFENTTGDYNTYLGSRANKNNTTGNENTILGSYAGFNNLVGNNNVFIGYQAGYSETNSNRLYIESSNTTTPLIYGEFDNDLLRINGTLNVNDAYSFPTTDGTLNQILVTDGAGNVNWTTVSGVSNQTLSLTTNTLNLSNGGSVDLSGYLDNTDNQDLDLSGHTLSLTNDASTVDLSTYLDNTDNQDLDLSGNTLSLTNDASTVDLSGYLDNTDNQDLELTNHTLSLTNDNTTVDLSIYDNSKTAIMQDADNDTKIQVEEIADEDIIRFDIGGTESVRVSRNTNGQTRLELIDNGLNTIVGEEAGMNLGISTSHENSFFGYRAGKATTDGDENAFFGYNAGALNTIGKRNVFMGHTSGASNTTGKENVFMGYRAGTSNTTGEYNTNIGAWAGTSNTTGTNNVFMGYNAGNLNTTGGQNTSIGAWAGIFSSTGNQNTFIGSSTGINSIDGNKNTYIGASAGFFNQTGDQNIFIGFKAGYNEKGSNKLYIENSGAASPLIFGDFSKDSLQINGKLNINGAFNFPTADGTNGQVLATNGNGDVSWTNNTIIQDADNDTKIQVEESADEDIIRFDVGGTEAFTMSQYQLMTPVNNTNVAIGQHTTLSSVTTGAANIALGGGVLENSVDGLGNVAIGFDAGNSNSVGNYNVFLGFKAGFSEMGSNKLYIHSSQNATTTPLIYGEFDNSLLRINGTLNINNTYSFPTTDGTNGQVLATDGNGAITWTSLNTTIIQDADSDTKIQVEESADEDIIRFDINGMEGLRLSKNTNGRTRLEIIDGEQNTIFGEEAGMNMGANSVRDNSFFGYQAGKATTTGERNTFIGTAAGANNTTGQFNTFLGNRTGHGNTTGEHNTYIGSWAGFSNSTGDGNTFIGNEAGRYSTGEGNTFIGVAAGEANTGNYNI